MFLEDVLQCPCGGRWRVLGMVFDSGWIERILRHLGLPWERPFRALLRALWRCEAWRLMGEGLESGFESPIRARNFPDSLLHVMVLQQWIGFGKSSQIFFESISHFDIESPTREPCNRLID